MSQIHLVHTNYHILLACTIVKQENQDNAILIIYEDFDINYEYIDSLKEYFLDIYVVPGKKRVYKTKFHKIVKFIYDEFIYVNTLINKIKKISNLYVYNDLPIKTQLVMRKLSEKGVKISGVEDGSAAYTEILFRKVLENKSRKDKWITRKHYKAFLCSILPFLENREMLHVHSALSEIYLLFAESANSNILCKRNSIDKKLFSETIDNNRISMNVEGIDNSIIMVIDHSSSIVDIEVYKRIIEFLIEKSINIYVKYHPREHSFFLNEFKQIKILNHNIPAEFLISSTKDSFIISDRSTIFLTGPIINDSNRFISINRLLVNSKFEDINLESIYKKNGVNYPETFDEFKKTLISS